MTERAIHDTRGIVIGVVTQPARGRWRGHTVHQRPPKKFTTLWEAAVWLHAVHDNEV